MTRITKHRIPPPKRSTRPTLLATCLFGVAGWVSPLRAQQPPAITYAASLYYVSGMAGDPQGNVYVVGSSAEVFSTTPGVAYPTPPQGDINSYLIKLDPHGGLVFATYLPGDAFGVAADQNGNAYVGAFNGGASGQRMGLLVAMVDPTGAKVTLTQTYGGTCTGSPLSCGGPDSFAIDGHGDAYLAGNTSTTDFPTTPGAFQPKLNCTGASGCQNGFIIKLNPKTGQVVYATYLGGSASQDYLLGLATDTAGNLYGVGDTHSSDFPVTPNAYRTTLGNGATSFITKLNPLGAVVYSTYFDALDLNGVAVDASGAAFVTGYAQMGTALTPDAAAGGAVVAKLSPDGKSLVFSALFDHDGDGMAIAVDTSGSPSVIGGTQGTLLPEITPLQGQRGNTNPRTTCDPGTSFQHSCWDAFLVKLDPQGKRLVWASTLGGKGDDWGKGIALDTAGNIYAWIEGFAGLPLSGMFTGGGGPSIIKVEPVGPPPLFAGTSVVSSAGFAHGIAGGGLVSIFGTGLSTADGIVSAPSFPLPTTLAETSVWFGGRPASILAAAKVNGQEQVNVQFPVLNNAADFNTNFANVIMRSGRTLGFAFDVEEFNEYWPSVLQNYWPSIFLGTDGQPIVTHADYSLVTASNPAHAGETIIVFATGLGAVTPPVATGAAAPLSPLSTTVVASTVTIGGAGAAVTFSGLAPGFAGLYQVNVVVPAVSPGQVKLTLGATTVSPVTVTIAIQ